MALGRLHASLDLAAGHHATGNRLKIPPMGSFADLIPDDPADCGTANCANGTASGKDSTCNTPDASADGRVLVLLRHTATGTQTEQHDHGERTGCQ